MVTTRFLFGRQQFRSPIADSSSIHWRFTTSTPMLQAWTQRNGYDPAFCQIGDSGLGRWRHSAEAQGAGALTIAPPIFAKYRSQRNCGAGGRVSKAATEICLVHRSVKCDQFT